MFDRMTCETPQWPAPPSVRAACSTRSGGVSRAPWDSFNLGDHVGDAAAAVAANRAAFARALQAQPVFLQQVHGSRIETLTSATPGGLVADGCVTTERGVACTIMVADCLPILLCDRAGTTVAAAHAGWRGLAGQGAGGVQDGPGIVEAILERFWAVAGIQRSSAAMDTIAWLGPCIGPTAFEVGADVQQAFTSRDPGAFALFRPRTTGKWLADLPGLARRRLAAMGVTQVYGNDGSAPWCTVTNPSRFFSHRRDGVSGRFAAAVWLA